MVGGLVDCPLCQGLTKIGCPTCGGSGVLPTQTGGSLVQTTCASCHGDGVCECSACRGTGVKQVVPF
jgi:DnaJ-class molecular chaperone